MVISPHPCLTSFLILLYFHIFSLYIDCRLLFYCTSVLFFLRLLITLFQLAMLKVYEWYKRSSFINLSLYYKSQAKYLLWFLLNLNISSTLLSRFCIIFVIFFMNKMLNLLHNNSLICLPWFSHSEQI